MTYAPSEVASNDSMVVIQSNDADTPRVEVQIFGQGVPDSLSVTPAGAFVAQGPIGGPFSSPSSTYVLSNASATEITWTVSRTADWLTLFPTNGTLPANGTDSVTSPDDITITGKCYFARYQLNVEYLRTDPKPRWDWSYFSFISNLYFFAAGIFAYRFGKELKEGIILNVAIPWGACIVLALLLFTELDKGLRKGGRPDLLIWAVGFTALCIWQSLRPCVWIGSKVLEYVGERSYSVYLLHPAIVFFFKKWIVGGYASLLPYIGKYAYFICAFLVLMIVLAVSELTYRFIEVPGIKLGRRYISKHAV